MTKTKQCECDFRHEALPDPKHYMRLLKVRHSNHDNEVKVDGDISAWSVDDVPSYSAISYTWGEPNSTTIVSMNGMRMRVQQNCEFALLQALNYGECRYIWIDAICIDQTNDEEKGDQVAMMGDIYWYAERVLACVGPHENDSELLTREIQRRHGVLVHASRLGFTGLRQAKWPIFAWMLRHRIRTMNRLSEALLNFLGRSYFSRVWILQELFSGQHVTICCGIDHIPIEALHGLCLLFSSYHSPVLIPFVMRHTEDSKTVWTGMKLFLAKAMKLIWILQRLVNFDDLDMMRKMNFHEEHSRYVTAGANHDPQFYHLSDAIHQVRDFQCMDPRDKVYGILAVVQWPGSRKVSPDYRKERYDLAVEVLQALVEKIPTTSDTQYHNYWAHEFVSLVFLSLELDAQDKNMKAAILLRRRVLGAEDMKSPGECQSLLRCKDYGWRTFRLFYDDGWKLDYEWPNECPPSSVKPKRDQGMQQKFHNVLASNGKVAVLVPQTVQPGDWIAFFGQTIYIHRSNEWGYVNLSLILREGLNGRFSIVGQGVFNLDLLKPMQGHRKALGLGVAYDLYFDPEDLLVLMGQECLFHELEDMEVTEIAERLATRACGHQGSSYAEIEKR